MMMWLLPTTELRSLTGFHLQPPLNLHLVDVRATVNNVSEAFLMDSGWNAVILSDLMLLLLLVVVSIFFFFRLIGFV